MTHAVHSWPAATPRVVAESCGTIALLDRTHHLTVVVTLSGHKALGNKHSNMCSLTLLQAPFNHIMCVQCHVAYLHTTQQQQCQMGSMQHLYKKKLGNSRNNSIQRHYKGNAAVIAASSEV